MHGAWVPVKAWRWQQAQNPTQQGCLALTIRSDDEPALCTLDLECDATQDDALPIPERQPLGSKNYFALSTHQLSIITFIHQPSKAITSYRRVPKHLRDDRCCAGTSTGNLRRLRQLEPDAPARPI